MRFCPNCGTPFTSGQSSTCQHCGVSLPIERITQAEVKQQAGSTASSPNLQRNNSAEYNTTPANLWQNPTSDPYAGPPSEPTVAFSQQPVNNFVANHEHTMPANQGNAYRQVLPPPYRVDSPIPVWSNSAKNKKTPPSKGLVISLALFTLLIIGSGFWLIYYSTVSHPAAIHAQATATTQAFSTANAHVTATVQTQVTGTAVAQANATGTAVAQATAETQATVTALQDLYTNSTSGTPDLNSSLNTQDNANWNLYDAVGGGGCAFTNGALHASVMQTNYYVPCFASNTQYSNFALQAQINIMKGDKGGLIFRGNETSSQFYLLRISQDGSYGLYVSKDAKTNVAIIDDSSTAINKGTNQNNLLTIIAKGNTIFIYINKHYVGSVSDSSYASGEIGVFASNTGKPTDVAFNNVQVWKL